jgi:Gas vesicle synthesis protein GvpL/GvpF
VTDGPRATYVYGVVAAADRTEIQAAGVGGRKARVRRVVLDGVAALVSDVPQGALVAARDLRAHWSVLEEAAARTTVLPVRLGTVMESDAAVADEFLAPNAERLAALLAELEGKAQLNIKGFYDEERLLREVVQQTPQVARMRERVQALPDAATYYDRIRLGELVSAEIDRRRARDAELVMGRLELLAEATKAEPPTTRNGAVNAAFLVRRDRVDDFSEAVERLAGELGDRIQIRYVGPLPPYSFADGNVLVESGAWG